MIKTLLYAFSLAFLSFVMLAPDASAQKKTPVTFKKGVAVVNGTIKADQTIEYVFRAKKNADVDISVDDDKYSGAPYPKFVLLKPSGKLFYDQDSANFGPGKDLMDILPQAGNYTVRLQLPEDMRNDGKPVKFTLRIVIK